MRFSTHGSYRIEIRGEIVTMTFLDQWNLQCAEEFFLTYKELIRKSGLKRFGVISDLLDFNGGTPEVAELFEKVSDWAKEKGQVARALVLDSRLKESLIRKVDKEKERFPARTFPHHSEALDWLKSLGLSDR